MSVIHTLACSLLWIASGMQDKTPDVTVKCRVSGECVLPCSFTPASQEKVEWLRQDVVVLSFEQHEDSDDSDSSEERYRHQRLDGRASIFPHLISRGNATLILRDGTLKDRGTYRCRVHTSKGEHDAKVILKVEAPIRDVSLQLSRLSGYEEMKCSVQNVFPAPRVTWATEPPTFEDLRPVTRMLANKQGLYAVDSRLRVLSGQPDLIYICKVTTSYGDPSWIASLREREIRGREGRDLTIPCFAPPYLNSPSLNWSFSNGEDDPEHILTFDSRSGHSVCRPPWDNRVELDGFRVPFGDGSLRLMDPGHREHTGSYSCVFSVPYNTHTERTEVSIDTPIGDGRTSEGASHWWIVALVVALLVVALAGMLGCLKMRGSTLKPRSDPEDVTELHPVRDVRGSQLSEESPLTVGGTDGQSGPQAGST